MKLNLSYSMVALGVLLGTFGFVRSGAISIALGSAAITYLRFQRSKMKRRIELVLPLALSLMLFVVALTLPHGK
jgi:hypothetical protein